MRGNGYQKANFPWGLRQIGHAAGRKSLQRWGLRGTPPTVIRRPMITHSNPVHVIGAGLAGSEAAWHLAQAGVPVVLHEMRPLRPTEAHQTENCAELVCS